jgi:regulator of RNase E activity RraA
LGIEAIASAHKGDVIVIDNRGDVHNNCWGEILSCAARMKGVSGVIIDGAARDVDACEELEFPVFARGVVPITARGRIAQEAFNCPIRIGDIHVRPGDILVGDVNGVVVIPTERVDEVLSEAEQLMDKEERMKKDLLTGLDVLEVDKKYRYEHMLKR